MTNRLGRFVFVAFSAQMLITAQVIAIRAGHLIDPDTGTAAANQVILVDAGKFTAIGPNLADPAGRRSNRFLAILHLARSGGLS